MSETLFSIYAENAEALKKMLVGKKKELAHIVAKSKLFRQLEKEQEDMKHEARIKWFKNKYLNK